MEQLQTNDTAEQAALARSLAVLRPIPIPAQVSSRALAGPGRTYSLDRPAHTVDHACMLSRFDMHSTAHTVSLSQCLAVDLLGSLLRYGLPCMHTSSCCWSTFVPLLVHISTRARAGSPV
jgi:hypothetical protein